MLHFLSAPAAMVLYFDDRTRITSLTIRELTLVDFAPYDESFAVYQQWKGLKSVDSNSLLRQPYYSEGTSTDSKSESVALRIRLPVHPMVSDFSRFFQFRRTLEVRQPKLIAAGFTLTLVVLPKLWLFAMAQPRGE
jgi:hypothetical protein